MQTVLKQIVPTKVYTFDRPKDIPDGPWVNEPDKAQWQFNPYIACMVKRGGGEAWCGYVGVTPGHPLFGVSYSFMAPEDSEKFGFKPRDDGKKAAERQQALIESIDVHGGLTFSSMCDGDEETGICHVATQPDGSEIEAWWFGFDCSHFGDVRPEISLFLSDPEAWERWHGAGSFMNQGASYKDYDYVRAETERLAAQLTAMLPKQIREELKSVETN